MKKPYITYQDFAKLDLRVGYVKDVEVVPDSRKLLLLHVDLGEDYREVEILTGMKQYVQAEDLIGKKFIFLANLEPKKMGSETSYGMMIAADDQGKPILISIEDELANGISLC